MWILRFLGFPEWDFSWLAAHCQGDSFIVNPFEISKFEFYIKARGKNLKLKYYVAFFQQRMFKNVQKARKISPAWSNRPPERMSNACDFWKEVHYAAVFMTSPTFVSISQIYEKQKNGGVWEEIWELAVSAQLEIVFTVQQREGGLACPLSSRLSKVEMGRWKAVKS